MLATFIILQIRDLSLLEAVLEDWAKFVVLRLAEFLRFFLTSPTAVKIQSSLEDLPFADHDMYQT